MIARRVWHDEILGDEMTFVKSEKIAREHFIRLFLIVTNSLNDFAAV